MAKHPLNHNGLFKLMQQAQQYQALHENVVSTLPEIMQSHVTSVGIEQSQLVIVIDEALWASKVRFVAPECLKKINVQYPGLNLCEPIKIRLSHHYELEIKRTSHHPKPPDAKTAAQMHSLSEKVQSKTLADALKRLSSHAEKRD